MKVSELIELLNKQDLNANVKTFAMDGFENPTDTDKIVVEKIRDYVYVGWGE